MTKKLLTFAFAFAMFAVANTAQAATVYVDSAATGAANGTTQADAYTTIEAGITNATAGDTVEIYGSFTNSTEITVNKALTLKGMSSAAISTSGSNYVFRITGTPVTIQDLTFTKTDTAGQNMIGIQANDATITGNHFSGQYNLGDGGSASRGFEVSAVTGFTISNNTFNHLRQPGYINSATGNLTGNNVDNSKGFVIVSESNVTITGNTFGTNIGDIAIICSVAVASNVACPNANNYTDVLALSAANNNAVVDNQTPVKDNTTFPVVYVDASAAPAGNGTKAQPLQTISDAITKVTSGGKIIVASGTYNENLTVNKAVTLEGANVGVNAVTGSRGAETVLVGRMLVTASQVTVDGFKITNPSYSGATIHGVQIFGNGPTITNITIKNNVIKDIDNMQASPAKGAYGIMVQADVSNTIIENNKIDGVSSVGWARGIEVTPSCGVTNVPQGVVIRNNSIERVVDTSGTDAYNMSVDWCSSVSRIADASQVTFTGNILDATTVKNLDPVNSLNISRNWWNTVSPDFTTATGTISFDPWCIVFDCTAVYVAPVKVPPTPASTSGGGGIVAPPVQYFNGTTYVQGTPSSTSNPIIQSGQVLGTSTVGQVLGTTTYSFTRDLSFGMRGDDVTELQQILMDAGYLKLRSGKPTKYFGPLTRAALIKWQQANGVVPTNGYFGRISREKLNK